MVTRRIVSIRPKTRRPQSRSWSLAPSTPPFLPVFTKKNTAVVWLLPHPTHPRLSLRVEPCPPGCITPHRSNALRGDAPHMHQAQLTCWREHINSGGPPRASAVGGHQGLAPVRGGYQRRGACCASALAPVRFQESQSQGPLLRRGGGVCWLGRSGSGSAPPPETSQTAALLCTGGSTPACPARTARR